MTTEPMPSVRWDDETFQGSIDTLNKHNEPDSRPERATKIARGNLYQFSKVTFATVDTHIGAK